MNLLPVLAEILLLPEARGAVLPRCQVESRRGVVWLFCWFKTLVAEVVPVEGSCLKITVKLLKSQTLTELIHKQNILKTLTALKNECFTIYIWIFRDEKYAFPFKTQKPTWAGSCGWRHVFRKSQLEWWYPVDEWRKGRLPRLRCSQKDWKRTKLRTRFKLIFRF